MTHIFKKLHFTHTHRWYWISAIFSVLCVSFGLSILGFLANAIFVLFSIMLVAKRISATRTSRKERIYLGTITVLTLFSLCGTILYYAWYLNTAGIAIVLLLVTASISTISATSYAVKTDTTDVFNNLLNAFVSLILKPDFILFLLRSFYIALATLAFLVLKNATTTNSISSPWLVVPGSFFILYGLATALLIIMSRRKLSLVYVSLHYFFTVSIALFVYTLGYGFDPFIHQATESHIATFGTITPKPLYYIGQYALVIELHRLFTIPIAFIDSLLVPLGYALMLPSSIAYSMKRVFPRNKKLATTTALIALLALPMSDFIVTTPQNFANLLLLILILLSIPTIITKQRPIPAYIFILLALTILCIHPLSGIPAMLFTFFILIKKYLSHTTPIAQRWIARSAVTIASILGSVSIAVAFSINTLTSGIIGNSGLSNTALLNAVTKIIAPILPHLRRTYNALFDITYLAIDNYMFIFFIICFGAFVYLLYQKKARRFWPYIVMVLVLYANYIVMHLILSFSFLIEYERGNYTERLLTLTHYFLLPLFLIGIVMAVKRLHPRKPILFGSLVIILSLYATAQVYGTYPITNAYQTSHFYNISATDITAVQTIDTDAEPGSYVVLANQNVSAAALQQFGFRTYFKNTQNPHEEVFYYPIPTGGSLYQVYLDMVYDTPSREHARQVATIAGVDTVFFVINSYWTDFDKITNNAIVHADSWKTIDNGAIYIFKYSF